MQATTRSIRFILCLFLAVSLLAGCQAASRKSTSLDRFDATPVTTPTIYRYAPASGQYLLEYQEEFKGKQSSFSMPFDYSMIEDNIGLSLHAFVDRITVDGQPVQFAVPLVTLSMEMDTLGVVRRSDATFPAIEGMPHADSPEMREFKKGVRSAIRDVAAELPAQGIVTGDKLVEVLIGNPAQALLSDEYKEAAILRGEFVQDGLECVLASLDTRHTARDAETGRMYDVVVTGHFVIIKSNMDTLSSEMTTVILDTDGREAGRSTTTIRKVK